MNEKNKEIPGDDYFVFSVSQDMNVRNTLRTGLYEAQKGDDSKIPVFVSWPEWLEDGIICMYAKDYAQVLKETVERAARAKDTLSDSGSVEAPGDEAVAENDFQSMNFGELEHIDASSDNASTD